MDPIGDLTRRTAMALIGQAGLLLSGFTSAADGSSIDSWVGEYKGRAGTLRLGVNGKFSWQGLRVLPGSDAGTLFEVSGNAHLVDGVLRLVTLSADDRIGWAPEVLFPLLVGSRRFLVDNETISLALNEANAFGRQFFDVLGTLQRAESPVSESRSTPVAIDTLIPKLLRPRLLPHPLSGQIVSMGAVTSAASASGSVARLTIDLGEEQGAFIGMLLFLGPRLARHRAVVDHVEARRCSATLTWYSDAPTIGTQVSTAYDL